MNHLMNNRKVLITIGVFYLTIVGIYGADRILVRHEEVVNRVEKEPPSGYGYEELRYFGKIRVLRVFEPRTLRDSLTAGILYATSAICFTAFIVLGRTSSKTTNRGLYLLMAIAFLYLGLDESFEIHNTIGLNLSRFIHPYESLETLGDRDLGRFVIVFYAVFAVAVILARVRFFKKNRLAFAAIGAGFLLQGAAAAIDYLDPRIGALLEIARPLRLFLYREEFFEMTAAFLYCTALIVYCWTSIAEKFQLIERKISS